MGNTLSINCKMRFTIKSSVSVILRYGDKMTDAIGREILKAKKLDYKNKYIMKETPKEGKWIFLSKKIHGNVVEELTFIKLPDVFYSKRLKESVTRETSAFVMLVMDKLYKRNEIALTEWKGFKKCKSNQCRKCLTRQVVMPKSKKILPVECNKEYVFAHLDEFELLIKCKLFNVENQLRFTYLWIPIEHIKMLNIPHRNIWIRQILLNGIPSWVVEEWFSLSRMQIYNIKTKRHYKK